MIKYLVLIVLISCGTDDKKTSTPVVVVEPTPTPIVVTPTPTVLYSGPINSFQIMHIKNAKDLKKKLQREVNVVTLELDEITPEVVSIVHANGTKLIAYFSAGLETWREDAKQYPKDAIGDDICNKRGKHSFRCWPGEKWGDTRKLSLQSFLATRMDKAVALGVDGIEIDNTDQAYNKTGLDMHPQENIAANIQMARAANSRGLFIVAKNGPEMAQAVAPYYQGVYIEECNDNNECEEYLPFKGKIVAMKEYSDSCFTSDWSVCQQGGDYFED